MVAINPEMLRELLDEFTEKEEVTREEMNAINQQIAELEKRIESSKIKLAGLNKDREKIDLMRERYLSGNWKLQLSNMAQSAAAASSASAATEVSSTAPAPASSPTPSPSSHAEGRVARRAAREASSQPSTVESTESSSPEATTAMPLSPPLPEPVAEAAPALVPEPVLEPEVMAEPEPVVAVLPEPEPEAISEPEVPAADAPTFSSVAQFEAAQVEAGQVEAAQVEAAQEEAAFEQAPADDPIMSSFSSAPSNAPDINAALAYSSQSQEAPVVEPENSGFSWSSTAINAVPSAQDNSSAAPAPATSSPSSMPSSVPNPWGSADSSPAEPEVEQRQSAADIWGHPAAPQQAAPAAQKPEGAWGDFGEDWQMKEAEAQRAASTNAPTNIPAASAPPPAAASDGGWGQTAGGSPWSSPAAAVPAQPTQIDTPPAGGGWGQPTASRQGMPAMQAPTNFPLAAPPAVPNPPDSGNSAGEAWGRSGQASSSGWATQGSPWGDPAAQAQPSSSPSIPQTPTNPFSQPPASPAFAQPAQLPGTPMAGAPMAAPEQPAGDESRSSLARAADGALISPVKGRRRGAGTPAAFDWGSPDSSSSGNAGDPNQAGGADDSGDNKKIDDVLKGLFK